MKMDSEKRYQRLLERYGNGDIDRRSFFGLLGTAGVAAGIAGGPLAGWSRQAWAAVEQVRFDGWGGVVSEALRKHAFDPYEKETGVKVVDATFGGEEEVLTKVKAGQPGEFNLVHSSGVSWYKRWIDAGYGVALNFDNIPNVQNVMPALIAPFEKITPDALSAVPYDYGTTGIAYNTNHISKEEAESLGANLLLKPELKDKVGGYGDSFQTRVWFGALQTGQDPNNVQDIEAVWDKVREHRGLVKKYWASGAELMSLLAEEEIWVTEAWSGRVAALQQQGHPIGYMDPPNGLAWMEDMFVIKGSPVAECEQLLNFMLATDVSIAVAEGQNYPPALDPTKVELTDKIKALPAFDPTGKMDKLTFGDPTYWTENEAEWKKTWNRIKKGF